MLFAANFQVAWYLIADWYLVEVLSFCLIQHSAMEMCKDKEVKLHLFLTSDIVTFKSETLSVAKVIYSSLAFRGFAYCGVARPTLRNTLLCSASMSTSVRTVQQLELVFEPQLYSVQGVEGKKEAVQQIKEKH